MGCPRREVRIALLLLLSSMTYGSHALSSQSTPIEAAQPPADVSGVGPSTYQIGPGDVLHISVWDEAQLTETVTVRPDGKISLPLIYEVNAAGMTPEDLQKLLTEKLTRFVRKPRVTVTIQEIHSRMVFITGEVQRPGAYPLAASMDVVQAIARAGGFTDFAKPRKVYVLRADKTTRANVNYEKVVKGQSPEQNVDLKPGDTVVVP